MLVDFSPPVNKAIHYMYSEFPGLHLTRQDFCICCESVTHEFLVQHTHGGYRFQYTLGDPDFREVKTTFALEVVL